MSPPSRNFSYCANAKCPSSAYCWGNFAGPFVVKQSEAPHFQSATIGLLVGYAIKLVCHVLLLGKVPPAERVFTLSSSADAFKVYMFLMNRHRDKEYGPADKLASDEAGMRDHTEFENKDFRYVL